MAYLKGGISHFYEIEGIPEGYCYGFNKQYNILVMELFDKSLDFLFNLCNKKFSLKTVCLIGIQTIERLKHMHDRNLIHRDVKPENFLIGLKNSSNKIHIIDFGLSNKYRSSKTKEHYPIKENQPLVGTLNFASLNALKGIGKSIFNSEQSRRDDLESLCYMLIYFLTGSLPWDDLKIKEDAKKIKRITELKATMPISEICKDTPVEISTFLTYTRNLDFEKEPDYSYLTTLLKDLAQKNKISLSKLEFDWTKELSKNPSKELITTKKSINM